MKKINVTTSINGCIEPFIVHECIVYMYIKSKMRVYIWRQCKVPMRLVIDCPNTVYLKCSNSVGR